MPRIFLPLLLVLSGLLGSGEVIHACVTNGSGAIRIVSAGTSFTAGETQLTWGVVGVQGPTGLQGPAGPPGEPGVGDLGCTTDQIAQWNESQRQWVCGNLPDLTTLEAQVTTLQNQLAAREDELVVLAALVRHVSVISQTIVISGANLQIVNGTGTTTSTNGLGNVIIGYNEARTASAEDPVPINERTGSHMLVVGQEHNYTSFGGIVVGAYNTTSGPFASVSGGQFNGASGEYASVSGGDYNQATGAAAAVSGGQANTATSLAATVSGGSNNKASGYGATVSGGVTNTASGRYSTVSGGSSLVADGVEEYLP